MRCNPQKSRWPEYRLSVRTFARSRKAMYKTRRGNVVKFGRIQSEEGLCNQGKGKNGGEGEKPRRDELSGKRLALPQRRYPRYISLNICNLNDETEARRNFMFSRDTIKKKGEKNQKESAFRFMQYVAIRRVSSFIVRDHSSCQLRMS